MSNVLVGYGSGVSKKNGKPWYRLDLVCDNTMVAKSNGAIGRTVKSEFVPEEVFKLLSPDWLDKKVEFEYEIFGRYANIVGIKKG